MKTKISLPANEDNNHDGRRMLHREGYGTREGHGIHSKTQPPLKEQQLPIRQCSQALRQRLPPAHIHLQPNRQQRNGHVQTA